MCDVTSVLNCEQNFRNMMCVSVMCDIVHTLWSCPPPSPLLQSTQLYFVLRTIPAGRWSNINNVLVNISNSAIGIAGQIKLTDILQ